MQAGKGKGYEQWATIYNLKEASKTINFLTDNGASDYHYNEQAEYLQWELGKIAMKLKPEIEARARANQSAAGSDKTNQRALLTTLSEALSPANTRKELADAVGIGEVTMGKVIQIDEHAPVAVREALDNKELSINQGYCFIRREIELHPAGNRTPSGA